MAENWVCKVCLVANRPFKFIAKEMMFGSRLPYTYLTCENCGTLQIEKPVIDVDLLYPRTYYSFNYDKNNRIINFIKHFFYKSGVKHALGRFSPIGGIYSKFRPNLELSVISKFLVPGISILDVGCGTGILIKTLAQLGYPSPIGIDPYISQSYRNEYYSIEKVDIQNFKALATFDLIMLHHSFEHMSNPNETLAAIFHLLKPDGRCIIRIPVSDSYAFEYYKENWVQMDAPRHNFLHTTKGITFCAQRNGFQIEEIIDDSTDFQIIGSEQYKKNIALTEEGTFFMPLAKQLFGKKRPLFTKAEISTFRGIAKKLRMEGKGDQKVFILRKD